MSFASDVNTSLVDGTFVVQSRKNTFVISDIIVCDVVTQLAETSI